MSWLSENYEKAAIGGAAVVALGLAFLGWSKLGAVDEEFASDASGTGNRNAEVAGADRVPQALASLKLDRTWSQADTNGRSVNLFTGVPLFVERDNPTAGLDLITGRQIHPPIENTWWVEHGIDPGYADSPQRDPDDDGFSNLEEYQAGTNPADPKSHPALVAKLRYVGDESVQWVLRPGTFTSDGYSFEYGDSAGGSNRASIASPIKPGELFFREGPMKERFKLLGHEARQELNPRTNLEETINYIRVEDQRPNKKGTIYEIPASFPRQRQEEFSYYDRTAVFTLEALGYGGQEFRVEENTTFALPPESGERDHLLKSVTPEAVEVEYPAGDGERGTVDIPKGGMPDMGR